MESYVYIKCAQFSQIQCAHCFTNLSVSVMYALRTPLPVNKYHKNLAREKITQGTLTSHYGGD